MAVSHAGSLQASAWLRRLFGKKSSHDMYHKGVHSPSYGIRSYMVMPGQAAWSERDYKQFAQEAYIKNVIAHRAISMVSAAAASVRPKLYTVSGKNGRKEVKFHPLMSLIKKPNPSMVCSDFFQSIYHYYQIGGNAFIQAVGAKDLPPQELHLLRPDRVQVIAGKNALPAGYRYTVGGVSRDFPVDRVTGMSRVLHIRSFHPLSDWYGLSPVEAAAYSIDQHNQSGAWNQALLQNGARPSGALVVRADAVGGGTLSEEQFVRVKQQIDEQFSGPENAGRPLLLEGGLDWKEMSMSPKDMDFIEAKHSSARDIALAFGVPPQLLGIPGDNTYSNLQEARLALWEQTVVPLVQRTLDTLNHWLVPMFGGDMEMVADTDSISALAIRNQVIWDRVERASFLTEDEKRAAVGYGAAAKKSAIKE
jgi:HK97 family phage portal protein